ncbi:hypothetical protein NT2_01_05940 [Caenibius tardaugens NBRC 16725]|uniref:Uncharacterized protein n=1 Tax=Caenibius tardaugens NBRC 16725 TaxID=1219035 RepID=U2YHZ0_9SPHN|nr:hypothetical protein NT2_01_05940 [Caenibius tardaugens NBRC 16725]
MFRCEQSPRVVNQMHPAERAAPVPCQTGTGAAKTSSALYCSSASDKVDNQKDNRSKYEQMNSCGTHMEYYESQSPQHDKRNRNCQKHDTTP